MPSAAVQESCTDVLIIGAGPAGLMAAAWMARLGVKTRIVDKRGTKIFNGQADGLQCRSLEIFDSFGFADRAWKESNHMLEMCMWNPNEEGVIHRSDRVPDTPPGLSRFQQVVLHQGRIERFFLDHMKQHSDIEVERGVLPETLEFDCSLSDSNDDGVYPITVKLRHLSDDEATPSQNLTSVPDGLFRSSLAKDDTDDLIRRSKFSGGQTEIVKAKYMIGCDGAHSWTRRQLGFELEGEATDYIWGVLDIIPITDFPDIRMRCAVHSADSGSLMNIPRENGLTRLYIQLKEVKPDASGRADKSKITPDTILKAAQKILGSYSITYEYCDWWTAYQIGQRVGKRFSDHERIFLAGDAVHTHSPKAGQGMNVSMQDCFNLGWKIGLCVNGITNRSILKTYQSERRRVAQDLIEFDHKFSRLFSGRPAKDAADEAGVSMAEFKQAFEKGNQFASGISVDYGASVLVAKSGSAKEQGDGTEVDVVKADRKKTIGKQELADNIAIGKRFPSFQVLNQADARPWHFQQWLISDGRFRIIIFAGDMVDKTQRRRVERFCEALDKPTSAVRRFTAKEARINSVIQILTLHSAPRQSVDIFDFPEILRPFDEKRGWEYNQIFVDADSYHEGHGHAYKNYGVDPKTGCVIITRPDQYVGYVGTLEDAADVEQYFEAFMVPAEERKGKVSNGTDEIRQKNETFVERNKEGGDMTAKPLKGVGDLAM